MQTWKIWQLIPFGKINKVNWKMHTTENAVCAPIKNRRSNANEITTHRLSTPLFVLSFFLSFCGQNKYTISICEKANNCKTNERIMFSVAVMQARERARRQWYDPMFEYTCAGLATDIDRFMPRSNDNNLSPNIQAYLHFIFTTKWYAVVRISVTNTEPNTLSADTFFFLLLSLKRKRKRK